MKTGCHCFVHTHNNENRTGSHKTFDYWPQVGHSCCSIIWTVVSSNTLMVHDLLRWIPLNLCQHGGSVGFIDASRMKMIENYFFGHRPKYF